MVDDFDCLFARAAPWSGSKKYATEKPKPERTSLPADFLARWA